MSSNDIMGRAMRRIQSQRMPEPVSKRRPAGREPRSMTPPVAREMSQKIPEIGSKSDIAGVDELFRTAGLVRSRREKAPGVARRARFQAATPEELSPPPPVTRVASNGVEWLPVPGWSRFP